MPDVTLPTPDEVEAMRERHVKSMWGPEWCDGCDEAWPCEAARLLALVEAQNERPESVWEQNAWHWRTERDEARARLAAVLAECARWEYVSDDTYWLDRIRRAATGEQL